MTTSASQTERGLQNQLVTKKLNNHLCMLDTGFNNHLRMFDLRSPHQTPNFGVLQNNGICLRVAK